MAATPVPAGPLAPKPPMLPAKAKNVIMLFMEGGPGHMDTFDPKPKLSRAAQDRVEADRAARRRASSSSSAARSSFSKVGESGHRHVRPVEAPGRPVRRRRAVQLSRLPGRVAQPPRSAVPHEHRQPARRRPGARRLGHLRPGNDEPEPARLRRHDRTGLPAGRRGQLEQRLPAGRTTRARGCGPRARRSSTSTPSRSSPASTSGSSSTNWRPSTRSTRRGTPSTATSPPGWRRYELAYRMQTEVPDVIDLAGETEATREMYGLNEKHTGRVRPPVPARPATGREGGPLRPDLQRRLGQPRLPGTRPHRAHPQRRQADRGPDHAI